MAVKKPCTINGIEYESGVVAAKALGISSSILVGRLRSPKFPEYTSQYHSKINMKLPLPCTVKGVDYDSEDIAAETLGISARALRYRLRSPKFPEYISRHRPKVTTRLMRQPCRINGVEYESEKAAARALGVNLISLRHRLRSSNYPEYTSRYHEKQSRRKKFIPCSVDGVEYRSIGHAASKLGIYPSQLKSRLASLDYPGYVCSDIPKRPPKPMKYKVGEKLYRTMQEIADIEGVTMERVRQKMNDPSYPEHRRIQDES